ncbi:unnamed protein product [Blepharisma stoltei]|uniref:COPI associated protein n=1 Tax=Blepharisma stoltei TaxID=1481888 RepID=A0AAU9K849_9CILI|nr:unnamed protein product [Blepharisma stoltei]
MVGQEFNDVKVNVSVKVATIICGVGLLAIAIQKLASFNIIDVRDFFLTLYYFIFAFISICSELPYKKLLMPFYFLRYCFGKGAFFLFVATIIFDWRYWWFILMAVLYFITACGYFVLALGFKEKLVDKTDETEEKEAGQTLEHAGFQPVTIDRPQEDKPKE